MYYTIFVKFFYYSKAAYFEKYHNSSVSLATFNKKLHFPSKTIALFSWICYDDSDFILP